MGGFLLVVGLLGFIVCIILLLIKLIKKNPLKQTFIFLGAFILLFFIGTIMLPSVADETIISDDTQEVATPEPPTEEAPIANDENAVEEDEPSLAVPVDLPNFEVLEVEDLTFSNVKRYNFQVVVDEAVNPEQLKQISEVIVEDAKLNYNFNALSIMYYDYKEFIGFGYTLGRTDFAPRGDWSKADTVNTGNYGSMLYKHDIRIKDWSQRLTPLEVAVWMEWEDAYDRLLDEDAAFDYVADHFSLNSDEARMIVNKQITWAYQNLQ